LIDKNYNVVTVPLSCAFSFVFVVILLSSLVVYKH